MKMLLNCVYLLLCACIAYLGLDYFAHSWFQYKLIYLKRKLWLLVNRCPRCNTSVNRDRNGRALCPECGRAC